MENNLPQGWVEIELIEAAADTDYPIGDGDHGQIKPTMYKDKGVPYIRVSDMGWGNFKPDNLAYIDKETHRNNLKSELLPGDVLIAKTGATIGKCCIVPDYIETANTTSSVGKVTLDQRIMSPKYLLYYFLSREFKEFMWSISERTAQPGFNIRDMVKFKIPLPPKPEHDRIVTKLDALMQKVESNKQRLEKIPKLLKRFRQSVLAAAVNNDGEEEITKNVCEEIQIGPFGTQLHSHDYISNGIPLVNPTHIQKGEIVPDMDLTITKQKFKELSNYHLKAGDVIMGRRGEMARCALVGERENGWLCGTGSLFFRPNTKKVHPQYLYWVLSNSNTKAYLENEAKGSTMSNLNLNIVKNIPFPLPSIDEQKKIVKQVEQLFAFADKLEARYTKAKTMLDKLPQSILAKAFRGELVPQDPEDEPASVLLEKIKAEKEKLQSKSKSRKKQV